MKLKLLFFMGILSVFYNTVMGQNVSPPSFLQTPAQSTGGIVSTCPKAPAANTLFRITDTNTDAADILVTASPATGPGIQTVSYILTNEGDTDRRITVTPTAPFIGGSVLITITLRDRPIGDPTGFETSTTYTVNFEDLVPPLISYVPVPLELDSNCSYTIPDYTTLATVFDACATPEDPVLVTQSVTAGDLVSSSHNATFDVTLTADDNYGNMTSITFTVTVIDTIAPMVITQDIEVSLDAAGNVAITPDMINDGSSDNCTLAASLDYTLDISSFDCSVIGNNTVTLFVTDGAGNTSSATATVTVLDEIAPIITCPGDISVNNDLDECGAVVTYNLPTVTDNCLTTSAVIANGSFQNQGSNWLVGNVPMDLCSLPFSFLDTTFAATCNAPVVNRSSRITETESVVLPAPQEGQYAAYTRVSNGGTYITQKISVPFGVTGIDLSFLETYVTTPNPQFNPIPVKSTNTNARNAMHSSKNVVVGLTLMEEGDVNTEDFILEQHFLGESETQTWNTINNFIDINPEIDFSRFEGKEVTFFVRVENYVPFDVLSYGIDDLKLSFETRILDAKSSQRKSNSLKTAKTNAVASLVQTEGLPSGSLFPVGTTINKFVATDESGNSSSCTFTVTVTDNQDPNVIAQNITVQLDEMGTVSIVPADIDNGSTDNCGIPASLILSLDITSFDCTDLGANTVVLTVEDVAGNIASASATVTVEDNLAPVITVNGDLSIMVNNDIDECGATVSISASADDNCSGSVPVSFERFFNGSTISDGEPLNALYKVGTTIVVWTAVDNEGNTASATQTITVKDVQPPTITSPNNFADLVRNNDDGECFYTTANLLNESFVLPTVLDNCGNPASLQITLSPETVSVSAGPDNLPAEIVWTVTDAAGNTATATQSLLVQDLERPVMRTKNITLYFDANGQIIINPEDVGMIPGVDNGSTDNSGTSCFTKYVVPNILYCGDKGDNSVILTGTDLYGNQHYKEATVTAVDNTNPTITAPANVSFDTNTGCTWVGSLATPVTADNCSVLSVTNYAPSEFPLGNTDVMWTVTDASGNSATTTQIVTVTDGENPVAIAKIGYVVTLNSDGEASITALDIDNGSTDNCLLVGSVVTPSTFTCANVGANLVTLTVEDAAGNTSSTTTIVTVKDDIAPSLETKTFEAELSDKGVVTISAEDVINLVNTEDACGIKTMTVSPNTFSCANLGDNEVTVTVTDNNGNFTTDTAIVTVEDNEDPTISVTPITVDTNAGCTWNGTLALPVTSDNCSVVSVLSYSDAAFTIPLPLTSAFEANKVNNVYWQVTDAFGNTATAIQTVTVNDNENPIANANSFTVYLDANGSVTITAAQVNNNSTDNCGVDSVKIGSSLSDELTFDCDNVGENTVVLTVTDASGNFSTTNATITVVDNTAPQVVTVSQPYVLELDVAGNGSIVATNVDNGSNDACGIKTMSVSPNTFTCANVGLNTVILTVTDNNNNVSTGTAIVTVKDEVNPTVVTKPYTVQLSASGAASIVAADVNNGSSDACGIKSMSVFPDSFDCDNVGPNPVILTVIDNNNNVSTGTATVIVEDKVAPIVIAKPISVLLNGLGTVSISPADVNDGSSDACGIDFYTLSKSTFDCSNIGLNSVILTATDVNGNVSLPTTVFVTVSDKEAPTVNTKDIEVQLNVGGFATIVPADVNNVSTDACGIASYSLDKTSFNCDNVGDNSVTLTVIDIYGNIGTKTANVKVFETVKPIARPISSITLPLDSTGNVTVLAKDLNNGSTDNCGIVKYTIKKDGINTDTHTESKTFTCADVSLTGTNYAFIAYDASTNESVAVNVLIKVVDNIKPTILTKAITVQLNDFGTFTIAAADVNNGSSDNCGVPSDLVLSISKSTFTCDNVGENIITLTGVDKNGNVNQAFATVNVEDKVAPNVITKPISLVLDGDSVSIEPEDVLVSATDACGVDVTSYDVIPDTFDIDDVLAGSVVVTVYATDVNGNVGSQTATVTFPRVPAVANEVITPNNDGTNDFWVIDNIQNHPDSVVKVYNTWGSLVFSAKNYQNNWDGKINGNDVTLPDGGSYYYQIDLDGNGTVDEQGWLYITRQ